MKALQIIHIAYRATIEEQDDTIVWLCHAVKGAGADIDVLLTDFAVNYAVRAQNSAGLTFGDWEQTGPPRPARDLASLLDKEVSVYLVTDDLSGLGIGRDEIIDGIEFVDRADVGELFDRYDAVWRW